VFNESSSRLLDVKIHVDIVDASSRPLDSLEGGLSAGGVMAPNSAGAFDLEVKTPLTGSEAIQSPRGYGEVLPGAARATTAKE
jgi:hypothetical protein